MTTATIYSAPGNTGSTQNPAARSTSYLTTNSRNHSTTNSTTEEISIESICKETKVIPGATRICITLELHEKKFDFFIDYMLHMDARRCMERMSESLTTLKGIREPEFEGIISYLTNCVGQIQKNKIRVIGKNSEAGKRMIEKIERAASMLYLEMHNQHCDKENHAMNILYETRNLMNPVSSIMPSFGRHDLVSPLTLVNSVCVLNKKNVVLGDYEKSIINFITGSTKQVTDLIDCGHPTADSLCTITKNIESAVEMLNEMYSSPSADPFKKDMARLANNGAKRLSAIFSDEEVIAKEFAEELYFLNAPDVNKDNLEISAPEITGSEAKAKVQKRYIGLDLTQFTKNYFNHGRGVMKLCLRDGDGYFHIETQNEGKISYDNPSFVFEKEASTKGAGRGTGLYLVKMEVQYLGGEVVAKNLMQDTESVYIESALPKTCKGYIGFPAQEARAELIRENQGGFLKNKEHLFCSL